MGSVTSFGSPLSASPETILVLGTVPAGQTLAVVLQMTVIRAGTTVPQYFYFTKQYTAAKIDMPVSDTITMPIVPKLLPGDTVSFNGFSALMVQMV